MNISNKPIFEEKIEMIKKRPDYILNQNNESTNPTLNNNKLLLYSNEITKNIKSPKYMNNINMKGIYKDNEYFDVDELDSNNNISNNNTNTKLSKKNKNSSINSLYQDNKFFNANNEKIYYLDIEY